VPTAGNTKVWQVGWRTMWGGERRRTRRPSTGDSFGYPANLYAWDPWSCPHPSGQCEREEYFPQPLRRRLGTRGRPRGTKVYHCAVAMEREEFPWPWSWRRMRRLQTCGELTCLGARLRATSRNGRRCAAESPELPG